MSVILLTIQMSNTLFVLLDGAEDDPCPQFDGKKPYEVAEMPYLKERACHKYATTGRGYTHLFLNEFFTGHPPEMSRAAIEAMGVGLTDIMDPKRSAYRLSPAEIKDGMIIWNYHASGFREKMKESMISNLRILEGLDPKIEFFIGVKAILTMNCDDIPDLPAPPVNAPYVEVPGKLGEYVNAVREDMGGITDYPWGCGKFGKQYEPVGCINNLTAISNSPTALGICASLGYDFQLIDDIEDRFRAAKEALKNGDVFLHIDEVDEYSHQKDPFKKKAVLELIDRLMSEYFPDIDNIIYFVDHGTSCVTGEHILTNVPIWTTIDLGMEDGAMIPLKDVVESLLSRKR